MLLIVYKFLTSLFLKVYIEGDFLRGHAAQPIISFIVENTDILRN